MFLSREKSVFFRKNKIEKNKKEKETKRRRQAKGGSRMKKENEIGDWIKHETLGNIFEGVFRQEVLARKKKEHMSGVDTRK